jgi:L-ribulose-5-phosphate 3-epimerase
VTRIGIMQGRLVPPPPGRFQCFPRGDWEREPELASRAGLSCIEWIWDLDETNPLLEDDGMSRAAALAARHGVAVLSVCADYFMERPLAKGTAAEIDERRSRLAWLIGRCRTSGIERIVLPFVDASRLNSPGDRLRLAETLDSLLPLCDETGVEIHLETDLAPEPFAALLDRLPHPRVRVNYDSGNSASLGYRPREEFAAYGSRIGSVHIKDRHLGGGTVPLGTGDTDFPELFDCLRASRYRGDFILQAARGEPGDEVRWAIGNRSFVEAGLARPQRTP